LANLPLLTQQCPRCAEPNVHGEVCGHCLSLPPAFDGVICPYEYKVPVNQLIHQWKHHAHTLGPELLSQQLFNKLEATQFDYVVPVPYHWIKLLKRGHNPVRNLSRQLAKQSSTPLLDAITRVEKGQEQRGLNRKSRLKNLKKAFAFNKKKQEVVRGKNILLVDDVLTTGATCNAISLLLKRAGAKSVMVGCLARTAAK
jgi:ComF family protein